ncbi:MAG: hypothetical protein WC679_00700 [Bacteroidales bacterium]|jgi:hypothetical protein
MKYELNNIAICLPDYFSGSSKPVVQVPVTNKTTYREVKELLLSWEAFDHIEELDDNEYEQAVEELFANIVLDIVPDSFAYIEDGDDDFCEDVYMYFSITTL